MHDTAGLGDIRLHNELLDFGLLVEPKRASEFFSPAIPANFPCPSYARSYHNGRFFQVNFCPMNLHIVLLPVQCEEIKVGSDGEDSFESD